MNDALFDRVPLLVIDTATNTYTRYIGPRRNGRWIGAEPLSRVEVEMLRHDPIAFFGENDLRAPANH
jgi:hypothetical protein